MNENATEKADHRPHWPLQMQFTLLHKPFPLTNEFGPVRGVFVLVGRTRKRITPARMSIELEKTAPRTFSAWDSEKSPGWE